eukprot:1036207-Prymnesium_polylepis.1
MQLRHVLLRHLRVGQRRWQVRLLDAVARDRARRGAVDRRAPRAPARRLHLACLALALTLALAFALALALALALARCVGCAVCGGRAVRARRRLRFGERRRRLACAALGPWQCARAAPAAGREVLDVRHVGRERRWRRGARRCGGSGGRRERGCRCWRADLCALAHDARGVVLVVLVLVLLLLRLLLIVIVVLVLTMLLRARRLGNFGRPAATGDGRSGLRGRRRRRQAVAAASHEAPQLGAERACGVRAHEDLQVRCQVGTIQRGVTQPAAHHIDHDLVLESLELLDLIGHPRSDAGVLGRHCRSEFRLRAAACVTTRTFLVTFVRQAGVGPYTF